MLWIRTVFRAPSAAAFGAAVLLACAGCGTSDYNHMVSNRLGDLRVKAKFLGFFGPAKLANAPYTIQVPMAFKKSYTEESKIAPERLQPPFLALPGFERCYEGLADGPQGKLPFYCYVAAVPARGSDGEKIAADLKAKLIAALEGKMEKPEALEWEARQVDSPKGTGIPWKRLRIEAKQPFTHKVNDAYVTDEMPGLFELWLYEGPEHVVLVGWRTPKEIDSIVPEPTTSEITALMNAPAKPDLTNMPVLTAGTLLLEAAAPAEPDKG